MKLIPDRLASFGGIIFRAAQSRRGSRTSLRGRFVDPKRAWPTCTSTLNGASQGLWSIYTIGTIRGYGIWPKLVGSFGP